jgi:5-oxoprolinase (ATP-hydrolysing)
MDALRKMAAEKMRTVLTKLPDGIYVAEEFLDDGTPLKVKIILDKDTIHFDFSGSAGVHPSNMNATEAIVNSVVIYVMRLLLDEDIPLNDGLMEPVRITLPEGILHPSFDNNPDNCPAVVGGNVEISQRLTDTLLKAFGIAGCSQGTMNNVLFGNHKFGYYETVAGGVGAVDGFDGVSGIHQHMTNTRITDPEILEYRYPVRLHQFSIRKNSGGKGAFNGGDGLIREYEFLEELEVSLLTQHRIVAPYGMEGAASGRTGEQWIVTRNGQKKKLDGITSFLAKKHERLILKTPGGGGFGKEQT